MSTTTTTTARSAANVVRRLNTQFGDDVTFARATRANELFGTVTGATQAHNDRGELVHRVHTRNEFAGLTFMLVGCGGRRSVYIVDDAGDSALVRGVGSDLFVFFADR